MRRLFWFVLLWLLLTACTPTSETAVSPSPSPQTAVLPTATFPPPVVDNLETPAAAAVPDPTQPVDASPTAEPTPVEESAVEEVGVISGRTDEGAFFWGDPNAPITHIDYSDFL